MWNDTFLKYCCLYRQFSKLSLKASVEDMERLLEPCFVGDEVFQSYNETMKIKTTIKWFRHNTSGFVFNDCPAPDTVPVLLTNYCELPTAPDMMVYIGAWVFILIMIVCSNLLVISSIIKVPNLRSNVANLFIMSLSFSDLGVGFFVVPIKIGRARSNLRFCFSESICRFYTTADTTFFVASITNLLVIAIDRHLALNYPYKYPNWMTRSRVKIIICIAWLYALTCGGLANLKFDSVNESPITIINYSCSMNKNEYYVFLLFFLQFAVPVLAMGIIYFRILAIAKHHARNISESSIINRSNNNNNNTIINENSFTVIPNDNSIDDDQGEEKDSNKDNITNASRTNRKNVEGDPLPVLSNFTDVNNMKDIPSYNMPLSELGNRATRYTIRRSSSRTIGQYRKLVLKATKTVAVVYGTFVLCWFPLCGFSIALNICRSCYDGYVNRYFHMILIELLPISNSMLNVFIYAIMNNEFRRGFKKMLNGRKVIKSIKKVMHCQ